MNQLNKIIDMIPSSWDDISVDKYQYTHEIQFEDDDGFFSKTIKTMQIICDIDDEDDVFDDLKLDDIKILSSKLNFIKSLPQKVNNSVNEWSLIDFNNILVGQFIDIEFWLKNLENNLHKILSVIYQKTKEDEWGNIEFEPYIYDINKRSEIFSYISMGKVYGGLSLYLQWRENFINQNKSIFESKDEEELDETSMSMLSKEEIDEIKKDIEKEKLKADYAWPYFLYQLADGDIVKMKEMFNLKLLYVINMFKVKKLFEN